MKNSITVFGVIVISSILFLSCRNMKTEDQSAPNASASNEDKLLAEQALRAANDSLYAALNAMFAGNLEPLIAVWSHADDVTQMGPFGGRRTGWETVKEEFKNVADMKLGGKIGCKEMHIYAGTDLGYTVCVEEGENISPEGKTVMVSHRATNIFRMENRQWKLVHHHTDISAQLENSFEALKNE